MATSVVGAGDRKVDVVLPVGSNERSQLPMSGGFVLDEGWRSHLGQPVGG